ncbi:hypothetical protein O0544_17415 [Edwardsiella anguillarum]|nr:hypothetical protein [Edwardsiella anguillarum]
MADEESLNNKTKWSMILFKYLNIFSMDMKKPACAGLMFEDGGWMGVVRSGFAQL